MIRQVLADDACDDVVGAARCKRDDEVHRPRRICLRLRNPRHSRQRASARDQMQEFAARKFHFEPPFTSLNHLVGACEQCRRNRKAKRLCSVEVDNQIELGRLYNWQLGRLGTLENSSGIVAREPPLVWDAGTIADQGTSSGQLAVSVNCRDAMLRGQFSKLATGLEKER